MFLVFQYPKKRLNPEARRRRSVRPRLRVLVSFGGSPPKRAHLCTFPLPTRGSEVAVGMEKAGRRLAGLGFGPEDLAALTSKIRARVAKDNEPLESIRERKPTVHRPPRTPIRLDAAEDLRALVFLRISKIGPDSHTQDSRSQESQEAR